ncbi:MAG: hypothetical protein ACI97A_000144 [Planctomycetota bacterium]|jgi:hypothetical protein
MRFIGIALFAITLLCTLPGLGERDFWPPDGARYAGVAREMFRNQDYAVPHLNQEIYGDKPPGYFWGVQVAAWFRGSVDEGTARLPSIWAALCLVVLVGMVVAKATGAHAGFLSGMALLGTWSFAWQARYAQLDLLFAAFISLSALTGFKALEENRSKLLALACLWLGFAILVKGPLALLVIPLLLLWRYFGKPERAEGASFGSACLWGGCFLLLPVLCWMFWAAQTHGFAYVSEDLLQRNVLDRARNGLAHQQNWHFYFRRLPAFWAPWILFLPLYCSRHVRGLLGEKGRRLCGFSALWICFFLLLQSLFPGKRSVYTFIFCAPVAILLGHAMAAAVNVKARQTQKFLASSVLFLLATLFFMVGSIVLIGCVDSTVIEGVKELVESKFTVDLAATWESLKLPVPRDMFWSAFQSDFRLIALAMAAGGLSVLGLLIRRKLDYAIDLMALVLAITLGLAFGYGAPWLDASRSRQDLAQNINRIVGPGELAIFRHTDEGLLFYLDRHLPELTGDLSTLQAEEDSDERRTELLNLADVEAATWMKQNSKRFLLIRQVDREALPRFGTTDYVVVHSQRVGSKRWYDLVKLTKGASK